MTAHDRDKNEPKFSAYMNRHPITAHKNMTLLATSEIMSIYNVGALLVVDDDNRYVGIVSDKRITREALAKGRDPATTEIQAVMKANGVRHLVVRDGEEIVGILSLSDLIRFYTSFFE